MIASSGWWFGQSWRSLDKWPVMIFVNIIHYRDQKIFFHLRHTRTNLVRQLIDRIFHHLSDYLQFAGPSTASKGASLLTILLQSASILSYASSRSLFINSPSFNLFSPRPIEQSLSVRDGLVTTAWQVIIFGLSTESSLDEIHLRVLRAISMDAAVSFFAS